MSAHTPGPWAVSPRENRKGQRLQPSITAPRNGYRGYPVCVVSAIGAGEDEANARLIAAAPSMYDFVKAEAESGNATAKALMEAIHGRS